MQDQVIVVIGAGGMGESIARHQGVGGRLVIADFNSAVSDAVAERLCTAGFDASATHVDVGSAESVRELAQWAAAAGPVTQVIHTAGLSPVQATVEAILQVDLYGVAAVLAEFGEVVAQHGTGVVIASMAGHVLGPLPAEQEQALMSTPVDQILALPFLTPSAVADAGHAYMIAKRANILRVMAESVRWGRRGARVNSISPGVIATPMGRDELEGANGEVMQSLITASGTGRIGTTTDITKAAAFLLGPDSAFLTGTDLLVDGGVMAALHSGALAGG